jgi:hypothetical protein
MKNVQQFILVVTIIACSLLINCSSPTSPTNDQNLIGSWQQQGGGYAFTFNADKSYSSTLNGGQFVGGEWSTNSKGVVLAGGTPIRYSIAGNILTFDFPTTNSTYQKI